MSKKPAFWTLLQLSTILLYELLVFGGYAFRVPWLGWTLFSALMLLHIIEMKTALRIGKKHKIKTPRTILMNMLFGFTWWQPLKKGIIRW